MNKKGIIIGAIGAVVVAAVVCIVLLLTGGEEAYRSIQVFEIDGTCTVTRDNDVLDAYKNMKLQSGDKFEVGDGSYARLKLDDDKFVYLQATTRISMTAEGTANDSKTIIFVENGSMTTEVQRKLSATSSYDIVTPNTTMSIRGTTIQSRVSTDAAGNVTTDSCILEGNVDYKVYEKDADGNVIAVPVELPQGAPKSVKTESAKLVDTAKLLDVISNDKKDETIEKTIEEAGIKVEEAVFTADDFVGVYGELANEIAKSTIDELLGITETEPTATPEVTPEATPEVTPEPQNNTADGPLTNDDIGDIVYVDAPAGGETADNDSDLTNTIDTGSQDNTDDTYIPTTPTPEQDDNDTNQGRDNGDDNSGSTTGDNTGKDDKDNKDNKDNTGKDDKDKDDKDDVTPAPTPEPTVTPAPTSAPDPTTTPAPTSSPDPTTTPAPTNTPGNSALVEFKNTTVNVGQGQSVVVSLVDAQGHTADFSTAFGTYVVGSNSNKLPNSTETTNGYRVKVSEGYEFTGWYLNADDAANNVTSKAIDSIPSNQSGTVQLFPGVKAKTYTLKIVNMFPEAATFDFKDGSSWQSTPGGCMLTNIAPGTQVKLPVLLDLYGDGGFDYTESDDVGKIKLTANDRANNDFICYSTKNNLTQLDRDLLYDGNSRLQAINTEDEIRLVNENYFKGGTSINKSSMTITVNKNIDLYAYFAAQVQIATIGDCKINLGTEMPTVADIGHTTYPTNLGTTESYWEIVGEGGGEFFLNSYYMGFKPLETPKIVSPNGNTMPVSMEYKFHEDETELASGNLNPGGTFAASGSTNAPFSDDKTVRKYGWILVFARPVYYATLNLPSGVTITGNTSSSAMGVLESGTNSIKLAVDDRWGITLPDNVKGTSNLSGREPDDNTTDYFYLSKAGYELAGYKLTYSYRNGGVVTTDERDLYFGGSGSKALDVDEANGLLYADIQVAYCTGITSQGWDGYKDLVGGVKITPIFRSVTPFTFTSSVAENCPSVLTANNEYFNLVIDSIDTNYVKEIDLSNIIINAVRNSAQSEGVKNIACNSCKLLITNGVVQLVNGEGNEITDQTGDPVIICSGENIKQVKIPVNYINAETGKYDDYFCFGISKNSETGSYISYKNVFDVECGNPSANTSYKKTIDIGANEKYHYLGLSLGDNSGNIKVIDNFNDRYTDTREFLKYTYNGTTGFVGGAIYGGRVRELMTSSLVTVDGTDGDFAPTYDCITEQDYLNRGYNKPLSFNELVGCYYAGLAKIDKYTKIMLNGEGGSDSFNCQFVTGTSGAISQEEYTITGSERIDYDCRPSDWDNIYFTIGSKHYFVSLGDGSISSLDDDASV